MPPPQVATPAHDPNPDVPPLQPQNNSAPTGGNGYSGGGYSLPPAPKDMDLPKYGFDTKPVPEPKPAPVEKKPEKKVSDDDDSDDEDLMARLRNLQK